MGKYENRKNTQDEKKQDEQSVREQYLISCSQMKAGSLYPAGPVHVLLLNKGRHL